MKSVPYVYIQDVGTGVSTREVDTDCSWVFADNKHVATAKFDGVCCLIKNGKLYRLALRKFSKKGRERVKKTNVRHFLESDFKPKTADWIPSQKEADEYTGRWPGWIPITPNAGNDKYYRAAFSKIKDPASIKSVTCELIGPKVLNNPHYVNSHTLLPHGCVVISDLKIYSYEAFKEWLREQPYEGIVFHHPDGRMAKLTRKCLGLEWPLPENQFKELTEVLKRTKPAAATADTTATEAVEDVVTEIVDEVAEVEEMPPPSRAPVLALVASSGNPVTYTTTISAQHARSQGSIAGQVAEEIKADQEDRRSRNSSKAAVDYSHEYLGYD